MKKMKNLSIVFVSALLLFFCVSTVQAQNQSAQNSDTLVYNYWSTFPVPPINCPETGGPIVFTLHVHRLVILLPNGNYKEHFNANGEGISENGDTWIWHGFQNNVIVDPNEWPREYIESNRMTIIHGPKGAKLVMRVFLVVNGNGEIVQSVVEPFCE